MTSACVTSDGSGGSIALTGVGDSVTLADIKQFHSARKPGDLVEESLNALKDVADCPEQGSKGEISKDAPAATNLSDYQYLYQTVGPANDETGLRELLGQQRVIPVAKGTKFLMIGWQDDVPPVALIRAKSGPQAERQLFIPLSAIVHRRPTPRGKDGDSSTSTVADNQQEGDHSKTSANPRDENTADRKQHPAAERENRVEEIFGDAEWGFGFTVPAGLFVQQHPPDSNDTMILVSAQGDDDVLLTAWREKRSESTTTELLPKLIAENPNWKSTYKKVSDDSVSLSGFNGSKIFYRKTILGNGYSSTFLIEYPRSLKNKYDEAVEMLAETFVAL